MNSWMGASQRVDAVATKSALSPGLWLTGIVAVLLLPATPFLPAWAAILGWVIFTVISLGTFGMFIRHSLKDPRLLRSEEYSLKAEAMEICGDGSRTASDISAILNSQPMSTQQYIEQVSKK